MSSIKLTNSDRERVVKSLIEKYKDDKIKSLIDKAGEMATNIVWSYYPKEVKSFITKNKEYTNVKDTSVNICEIVSNGNNYCYPSISVKNVSDGLDFCTYSLNKKWKEIFNKDKEFISICNDIFELSKKANVLKSKMECMMDKITTVNRLREEFPEGYKAYYDLIGVKDDNMCDSFENLRAELNSK